MSALFSKPKVMAMPPLPPPPPPLPTPLDPSVQRTREHVRRRAASSGRQTNIKNVGGAQGLLSTETIASKKLKLGGQDGGEERHYKILHQPYVWDGP